ncbi:MAG: autotransporter-associated beta strand repeat-containing protein, partial [Planctomycetes bacterium]|nr:autotransporter-associated beta strand repeat-containing protein [Planctomycetota bacterium]
MLRFRLTLLAFAVLVGISNSLPAQVADYVGDFLPGTVNGQTRPVVAADGWDYMWNAGGVIGTAAGNYSSLPWWSGQNQYNFDGAGNLPRANPAAYVNLIGTGGHPGRGVNQGGVVDRYAIAAYTIQPGENGFLSIDNSSFSVAGGGSNGVDLRVYVNDTLMTDFIAPGAGGAIPFDMVLGTLNAGDTVYVAAGPNLTDGNDAFGLGYQLVTTADPSIALWDANGTPPENGGSGNWDTTSLVWSTSAGYVAWNNAGNMNANFGPTAGTVTLTEAITARSLSFSTGGYTIAGAGTLTLTGAGSGGPGPQTISVSSDTATISAPITGGNLTKVGGGTLVLTGNNTYLGATKIDGGVLTVNGSGAITQTDRLHNRVGGVTLNVQDSASITATNYMVLGDFSNASITVNQSGGTVTNLGTANNPGGNNVANRWGHWGGGNTTYNLSSGTLNLLNAPLYLSWDGDATLNVAGGTANIAGINMGYGGRTHNSTINLTSGTLNIGSGGITTGGTANKNINLGGGTLAASADWSSSMPMTLTGSGGRVRVDTNGHTVTLSGDLTGAGGLTKIDDGSLTLSGNTVTMNDQFYVANGTVNLNGSTVTANGGTQIADRGQDNVNPINAVLNINTGSSLTTRFIVGGNGGGSNINGTINQYDGTTVTTTGVTAENNGLRLGHYPGGNVTYNLMGGTLTIGDNRDLSAATDGTGWFNQTGGTLNVERIVVNKRGGTGGSGRVTLAGGTANIGGGGIITDSTPSKATLEYGGLGGIVRATASFSSPLDATLFGTGANTVSFDTNGNNITLSGVLGGSGGLNKIGAGTLTLNAANTYTGGTTVDGGTLSLGYASGGTGTIRGTLTVNAGGTVDYTQENTFGWAGGASVNVLNLVGGTVGGADYRNHFWNNFQLNMTGGTLNLGGTNNEFHNATITVNNAPTTAQILGVTGNAVMRLRDGTSAVFNVADGVQAVDLLVDVPITQNTGSSGITKNGAGRMEMTGISTFRGPTTVNDGVLAVNDGMLYNIGWQDALLTVNGGVLEVGGWADGDSVGIGRMSFTAANIVIDGGTIRYTGDTTTGNPDRGFTIGAGGATLDAAGGNTWRLEQGRNFGITSTAGGTLTLTGASDGSLTMNLSGAGDLVKNGTGTWTLGGQNNYTGGTTVNQGTLNLQGSNNGS